MEGDGEEWQGSGDDQDAERRVAGGEEGDGARQEGEAELPRQEGAGGAKTGGGAAPPPKAEPDGKHMPEHDDEAGGDPPARIEVEPASNGDGEEALARVEQEGDMAAEPASTLTDSVAGADVAVADGAEVFAGAPVKDQPSDRDRADEVGEDENERFVHSLAGAEACRG